MLWPARRDREDGRHSFSVQVEPSAPHRPCRRGEIGAGAGQSARQRGPVLTRRRDDHRQRPRALARGIEITVADEGLGTSEPDQQRVFAKFFRSSERPPAKAQASGLFLVRGLVGPPWAAASGSSRRKVEGSRFTLSPGPTRKRQDDSGRGGGDVIRVLVIDDEAPIRLLAGSTSRRREWPSARRATAGWAALARAQRPDVILLDVMPGLDGWRVAEMLLDDPVHPGHSDRLPHGFGGRARSRLWDRPGRSRVHHEAVQPQSLASLCAACSLQSSAGSASASAATRSPARASSRASRTRFRMMLRRRGAMVVPRQGRRERS